MECKFAHRTDKDRLGQGGVEWDGIGQNGIQLWDVSCNRTIQSRTGRDRVQDRMGQGGWNGIEQDRMG